MNFEGILTRIPGILLLEVKKDFQSIYIQSGVIPELYKSSIVFTISSVRNRERTA